MIRDFPTANPLNAWLTAEQGRFALFLPVLIAAADIQYFALKTEPPLWPAAILAVTTAAAAVTLRRHPVARAALLAIACASLGFTTATLATRRAAPWPPVPRTATRIEGRVARVETLPEGGRRVTIAAPALDGQTAWPRSVRIRLRDTDTAPIAPNDTLSIRALLRAPSSPTYPGGWDSQREAYFANIAAYGFALGPAKRTQPAPAAFLEPARERAAAHILAALPGARGAIAAAMLTGIGTAIPTPDRAAFQASGLAHLLAVAGLHIGIVMGLAFAACRCALAAVERTALLWPTRATAAIAALAAGGAYLLLTGGHIPILRSFAMATLVTLAVLTGRRAASLRALALAAAAILLAAPHEVVGVSFQMSFAAVMALIAGWEAARPMLATFGHGRWWRRPALYIAGLAATSLLAGTATLPFAAYHFGTATLWYVPANMLAVPVTALWVMPWGLAALCLMPLGLEQAALTPMGWGIDVLLWLAHAVAAWPEAVIAVPQLPPASLGLIAIGLTWACLWRSRLRWCGAAPILAGTIWMCTATPPDLFITSDAHLVAARLNGGIVQTAAPGQSTFDRDAPQHVWGQTAGQGPPTKLPLAGATAGGRAQCDATACTLAFPPAHALIARTDAAICDGAAVVLSAAALPATCNAPWRLDRAFVTREGAASVWFAARGVTVLTDLAVRGVRPWVLREAPPALVRPRPGLPMAQTE